MKIQLVNPCMNVGYDVNSRNGVMHPLGLLSLAANLRADIPEVDICILDGSLLSRDEINAAIGADIVGCTTGILSYDHALEVAELAKRKAAKVVFGGPLASELAETILRIRPQVDFVIRGDGERAFASLVKGERPESIPNLVWKDRSSIRVNPQEDARLDELLPPDRSLMKVEQYFRNYETINVTHAFQRPMTFYSGKGCRYAKEHGRCVFCARMDRGYRFRSPKTIWQELQSLSESFGADTFWDVADSVLSDIDWMRNFVHSQPKGFQPKFVIYGRADAVTPESCRLLRSLNCHQVFIGFESGSDKILKNTALGKTVRQSKNAAKLLADYGITLMGSFILGLPGETEVSVLETIDFAKWLHDLGNLETISASVLMPLPGSKIYKMLCNDFPEKYEKTDFYDLEIARRDWLSKHTRVSLEYLYEALMPLLKLGRIASSLGLPISSSQLRSI